MDTLLENKLVRAGLSVIGVLFLVGIGIIEEIEYHKNK